MEHLTKNTEPVNFPYKIQKLEGEIHNRVVNEFLGDGMAEGVVQVGPEKWILPTNYAEYVDVIYNFEAHLDDVFICTHPRYGTTWSQEMIWLICNNLNYVAALNEAQRDRFPMLEMHLFSKRHKPIYENLAAQTSQRFIKTHLPLKLMPRNIKEVGAKVVYVARNPKDVAVSYYNFHKAFFGFLYTGDFEAFAQYFMDDLLTYSPYWKHVHDGWNHRNDENVHFMFYEDLKFDLENSLKKLSVFLGHPLKNEDLPKLMDHLQFENVKKNSSINVNFDPNLPSNLDFVRRGKVGGNPEMTEEISKKFDEWSKKNLGNSDLKFPFL